MWLPCTCRLFMVASIFAVTFCFDSRKIHSELTEYENIYSSCWKGIGLERGLEFLANETIQLDIKNPLYGAVVASDELLISVGATLFHGFFDAEKMEDIDWWDLVYVCLLLDNTKICDVPWRMQGVKADGLADGIHYLTAWVTDRLGTTINCNSVAASSVFYISRPHNGFCWNESAETRTKWVEILSPTENSTIPSSQELEIAMTIRMPICTEIDGCEVILAIQVDEGPVLKFNLGLYAAGDFSSSVVLDNLGPGMHFVDVWVEDKAKKEMPSCISRRQFFSRLQEDCCSKDRVIVTAANAPYFPRLENLIGSIHFWEPSTRIRIYDLGLSPGNVQTIKTWQGVDLIPMPFDLLPAHVRDARIVAFKPFVILDSLELYEEVLWLDANFEIRRPLDEAWELLRHDGYFLTTCGRLFPTNINVRPQMLEQYNCNLPPSSRLEYTTAVVGVHRNSWFHHYVLFEMNRCCMDYACLWPPGTTFQNQRRDQSVLNAVICNHNNVTIQSGMKWYMWADQVTFLPTLNETNFNEMVLFSRRANADKPYKQHINYAMAE